MAIGDVSVRVVPDAENFWRRFRAGTAGQGSAEGRRLGDDLMNGLNSRTARGARIRVHADTAEARAGLADVEAQIRRMNLARLSPKFDDKKAKAQIAALRAQLAGPSGRTDINTSRATAQLAALRREIEKTEGAERSLEKQGAGAGRSLLAELLLLAPALAPLAGAAIAAGSGLAVLGGAGVLAITGLNREMKSTSRVGKDAAASVSVVKDAVHSLQSTAAKAALPGLQASMVAINTELPALRRTVSAEATIAGQVAAHLVRGIAAGFTTFQPIISAVGADVDTLAAHFEAFASGPGGAQFAKTLATDYANVKPVIESVVRAVADIVRAGTGSGLSVLHILGSVANVIDSFPTPVLTTIIDGFLAFRAATLFAPNLRSFAGIKAAYGSLAAATQLASTQRIAADTAAAAVTAETSAASAEAMLATAEAARAELVAVASTRGSLSADQTAAMQVQVAIADREIAAYEAVALAARASAAEQAVAAEAAAGAAASTRAVAGSGSLIGTFGKVLGPIALVATALPLLSSAFGDNGEQAQKAEQAVQGYSAALLASKGAIDESVRSQVAKNLAEHGGLDVLAKYGLTSREATDAVIDGGAAMDTAAAKIRASADAQGQGAVVADGLTDALKKQHDQFVAGSRSASQQAAAVDTATASVRAHAAALHADVASYQAATDAAAKSVDKTREQTVAFQLENDAASLLSQALQSLAGQNLDVATAQTSFNQSTNSAIAALKKNKDAILGHSDAALTDQQAVQGSVSAARQYADAVAKQTGSSDKAAAAYRNSRNALLAQLQAQGLLTPQVRKYINTLFDVKGVSDYLRKHPTVHDVTLRVKKAAADAQIHKFRNDINAIRQNRVPGLNANTRAGREAIAAMKRAIDDIRQGKKPKIDLDIANALRKKIDAQLAIDTLKQQHRPDVDADISYLQRQVDAANQALNSLHDRTISVTTTFLTTGTVPGAMYGTPVYADPGRRHATGGPVHGPGSGTSDSIPAWLSNGEYVVNAKASAKHRHLLDAINKGVRGFAAGGIVHSGKDWIYNGHRYSTQRAAENAQATATATATKAQTQATNQLPPDLRSLLGALSGSVAGVRSAIAAFIKDLKAAGASTRQGAKALHDEVLLIANQRQLVTARTRLANVTQYGDTVRGSLTGGFDPTKYGSVSDLIAGYQGQTGQNKDYKREVDKLRGEARGNKAELSLINTLAASGQSTSLQSLAAGSAADLSNATKAYQGYNASVQGGVDAADVTKYGTTQAQASKDVDRFVAHGDRLIAAIAQLAAMEARSHGKSGAHVDNQLEALAQRFEALARHGRRAHP